MSVLFWVDEPLGNCVLLCYREVPMKEAKEFAETIAAIFIETSARNAVNIEELFQKISMFPVFTVGWALVFVGACVFFWKVSRKIKGN